MKKKTFKLYVWKEFARDYTSGMAVAIARDVEEARKMVADEVGEYGTRDAAAEPDVYPINKANLFWVHGGG